MRKTASPPSRSIAPKYEAQSGDALCEELTDAIRVAKLALNAGSDQEFYGSYFPTSELLTPVYGNEEKIWRASQLSWKSVRQISASFAVAEITQSEFEIRELSRRARTSRCRWCPRSTASLTSHPPGFCPEPDRRDRETCPPTADHRAGPDGRRALRTPAW
jgi:hypothetical protein